MPTSNSSKPEKAPSKPSTLVRTMSLSSSLSNISIGWKMGLMVSVLFLGILGITVAAYTGMQSLKYQLSNIYDFMLIPIVEINHADTALADSQYHIEQLHTAATPPDVRAKGLADIESNSKMVQAIMARYDTEWVTTVSPEFTQALRQAGKLELQQEELAALAKYHESFDVYQTDVEKYLATVRAGYPDQVQAHETLESLETARQNLQSLISVNNEYADFSNTTAQAALRQALLNGGIILGISVLVGSVLSYMIVLSITTRLNELTRSASSIQEGKLDQVVAVHGRDEISLLGSTFNNMASQLKGLFESLEQRVVDRTKALTTSVEVSRRLSMATTPHQLAVDMVEQVQSAFHYYHAHIYFVDDATGDLVMAGGTGEAGATLLARNHRIPKGRGLVGRAGETNSPILVPDVTQAEGWLPNPLLPDTKSEAAVPISSGSQVLGILDVQQSVVNGLSEADVVLLQSLASQAAISLHNARMYEKTQAQAQMESLVNAIGQKIQHATSVEDTLQTAIRELGQVLGAPRVSAGIGFQRSTSGNGTSQN